MKVHPDMDITIQEWEEKRLGNRTYYKWTHSKAAANARFDTKRRPPLYSI